MFGFRDSKQEQSSDSFIDNVNIDRDGVVSLNLENEKTQSKFIEQINKLKVHEQELKLAK